MYVAGNIISLTSLLSTTSQSICKNSSIVNITYDVSYNATDATASGLPAGVSYSFTFPTLTISGTPTTTTGSPFSYSVTATGTCPASDDSTLTGTVTVKSLPVLAYVGQDSICEGFTSSVSPTSGGTWVSSSPAIATITNGGAISGLTGGQTQFTYTDSGTGCHDTLAKFTVVPLPTVAAITGTLTVCAGLTTQLADATSGGTWSSATPSVATINPATGLVTGVSSGSSVISYTVVSLGCTTVVTTTVTVYALPTVALITGTKQACVGLTTQLADATASGVWSSATPSVATISAGGLVTGVTAGTSLISYSVTNLNGCVRSDTTTITIYAFPVVAAITGTTTICEQATSQLADATSSGVWSSATPGVATIDGTGLITAVSSGTSVISYTVTSHSCPTTVNTTVTVNPLPIVASITGTTNVCVGFTTQLADVTPSGVWSSITPAVATIDNTGLVTGVSAGTSKIKYTVTALGCSTSDSTTVNVFALPVVKPITGTTSVCAGSTTQLSSLTPGGVWSSGTPVNATVDGTGLVTGVAGGTSVISYTVTTNGCATTVTSTVTITGLPSVAAITGNFSVCVGSSTNLADATAGGTWSVDDPTIATIDATGLCAAIAPGNATITYTFSQFGCSNSVSQIVTVNAMPIVGGITGTTTVCSGLTTQLACVTPGGVWTSGTPANATVSATGLVTGVAAGTSVISYAVTTNNCTTTITRIVTVKASPTVAAITSAGGTHICPLATSQLSCATPGGIWSSATPSIASVDGVGLATGVSSGSTVISYAVTTSGCTTTNTFNLTIDSAPIVAAITGSSTVCAGQTTQLSCATPGGVWSSASLSVATVNGTGLVTGILAGSTSDISYSVTANGCTTINTVTVTVNSNPLVARITGSLTVCSGNTTQLLDATPGGVWSSASIGVATVSPTGLVTGVTAGSSIIGYTVTSNGCSTTVNATVTVNTTPSVPAITGTTTFCANATSLLADATPSGTWSSATPAVATIDATTGLVSGVSSGTSLITYTVLSSGCSASQTTTVTINPLPVIAAITGGTNVCVGSNLTLSNNTVGGTWSSSDPTIATISNLGVLNAIKAGAINVSYTVTSSGCTSFVSSAIGVNALPIVAPITGTTTFCTGTTSQLASATNGGTWSSATIGVATIDGTGLVSGLSAGTSLISYSITSNGCTTTNTTTVTINTSPTVASITGGSSICMGSTLQLSSASSGGTWSSATSGVATINATGLVTSVSPGTSVISYSKTAGSCTTTQTDTVTVYALPVVASITGNTSICAGSTSQLADVTVGGVWSSVTPGIASIDGFGMVTGVGAGSSVISYAVTTNGCTSTVTTTVNVTGALVVSPISGTTTVCEGATTQLSDITPGGTWSSATSSVATINTNTGLVTAITAGTTIIKYSVVTNGVCPQIAQTTVTVNQVPTVNAITDKTVCQGGSVSAITFSGNSNPTYQWTNSNTAIGLGSSGTGNIPSFIGIGTILGGPAQTAVINVTPNMGGCVGTSKSFFITVNSLDNPAFSYSSASYCHLDANPTPTITGISGGTFTSSPAGLSLNSVSGIVNLASSTDGYYTITYTTSRVCPQSSTVSLSISNNPSVNVTSDQSICDGTNFNAINFAGNPGSVFAWTNTNNTIGLTSSGNGNISSFVGTGTIPGGSSISGTVVVTPFAGSCIGTRDTFVFLLCFFVAAKFRYMLSHFGSKSSKTTTLGINFFT